MTTPNAGSGQGCREPTSGKSRMAQWRARARLSGLRDVLVWVPDGHQEAVRRLAQILRIERGSLLPGEDKAIDQAVASLENLPDAEVVEAIDRSIARLDARLRLKAIRVEA